MFILIDTRPELSDIDTSSDRICDWNTKTRENRGDQVDIQKQDKDPSLLNAALFPKKTEISRRNS